METKQHELIYFNNIPVQKVSGSVFGKFNFGSGNVSGQISTTDEISYFSKDNVTLEGEDKEKFERLLEMLEDIDDVSNVYHNVEL
mgnify:CR=1 FL=1